MRIFIITMPGSNRTYINYNYKLAQKYNIEVNMFYGVKGFSDLNNPKLTFFSKHFLTPQIIGCGLSHIKLWKEISELPDDLSVVLEDDSYLNISDLVKIKDELIYVANTENTGIVQLAGNTFCKKNSINVNNTIFVNARMHLITCAYVLTKKSAKRLYDKMWLNYHVDLNLNIYSFNNYILENQIAYHLGLGESNNAKSNRKIIPKFDPGVYYIFSVNILWLQTAITLLILLVMILLVYFIVARMHPIVFIFIGMLLSECFLPNTYVIT